MTDTDNWWWNSYLPCQFKMMVCMDLTLEKGRDVPSQHTCRCTTTVPFDDQSISPELHSAWMRIGNKIPSHNVLDLMAAIPCKFLADMPVLSLSNGALVLSWERTDCPSIETRVLSFLELPCCLMTVFISLLNSSPLCACPCSSPCFVNCSRTTNQCRSLVLSPFYSISPLRGSRQLLY